MNILWSDKKRPFFGKPLSFTTYTLTDEKLIIKKGFLSIVEEEIQLYRILDITLRRSLFQRIFKTGTIHCCSADKTTPEFYIEDILNPVDVKELLVRKVEEKREEKGITGSEFLYNYDR